MTAALLRPPAWTADARCADSNLPPAAWDGNGTHSARLVCATCPVRFKCATKALENAEPSGLWGGLDAADRKRLAAQYGYERPGLPAHGTRSRRNHRTDPCRPDRTGIPCPAAVTCREAHRRWAAERRATGAWRRNAQPADTARAAS